MTTPCLHARIEVEDTWENGVIEVCRDCYARRRRQVFLGAGGRLSRQAHQYQWVSAGEQVKRALLKQER